MLFVKGCSPSKTSTFSRRISAVLRLAHDRMLLFHIFETIDVDFMFNLVLLLATCVAGLSSQPILPLQFSYKMYFVQQSMIIFTKRILNTATTKVYSKLLFYYYLLFNIV